MEGKDVSTELWWHLLVSILPCVANSKIFLNVNRVPSLTGPHLIKKYFETQYLYFKSYYMYFKTLIFVL